jgi:NADH-ubiquinone oxidoreductase chain 5
MNRISDVVFILAILLIINLLNTVDYLIIFNLLNIIKNESILIFNFEYSIFFCLSFFLVVGAIGKSAQIGLHT